MNKENVKAALEYLKEVKAEGKRCDMTSCFSCAGALITNKFKGWGYGYHSNFLRSFLGFSESYTDKLFLAQPVARAQSTDFYGIQDHLVTLDHCIAKLESKLTKKKYVNPSEPTNIDKAIAYLESDDCPDIDMMDMALCAGARLCQNFVGCYNLEIYSLSVWLRLPVAFVRKLCYIGHDGSLYEYKLPTKDDFIRVLKEVKNAK